VIVQRGCELGLFLPLKQGNLECTFCLDCVQACPHDNTRIIFTVPGEELADNRPRSVIGRLARRPDLAALALVFTFGALLNAFAMTSPVYALEERIADAFGTRSETVVLGLLFVFALGLLPLFMCGGAAWLSRRIAHAPGPRPGSRRPLRLRAGTVRRGRVAGALQLSLPHRDLDGRAGGAERGARRGGPCRARRPDWRWIGMRAGAVFPLQLGMVLLGGLGSIAVASRIAARDEGPRARRASAPWIAAIVLLTAAALWILAQPMEMRAAGLGG
jgi:hypothetical protein